MQSVKESMGKMEALLKIEHLNVSFATQTGEVSAVRDLSFSIPESGHLGLVGESGSGKSATSLAIMRLLPPQASVDGQILFAEQNLPVHARLRRQQPHNGQRCC